MGKIFETTINRFDGGISEDKRSKVSNKYVLAKHFDTFTYPHKLLPYYKTIARENKSYLITSFVYAPNPSGGYYVYGLGEDANGKSKVYYLDIDGGGTSWQTPANNLSSYNRPSNAEQVFFYYKNYIYMWASNWLTRFDTQGGAFNNSYQSISWTNVCQPIHHPNDDIAYFFSDNNVHTLNNTSWTANALTLPDDQIIKCACAYGNYLAIGCVTKGTAEKKSIVYLWDRDSSLTTLNARMDFGTGEIIHLADLNNKLIGVVSQYMGSTLSRRRPKIIIKQASGDFGVSLNEITSLENTTYTNQLTPTRIVENNKLYFPALAYLDGNKRLGIWAIDSMGNYNLEIADDEITNTSGTYSAIQGIIKFGNTWLIAHSDDGSVNITDPNLGYQDATYESLVIGNATENHKLLSVTVTFESLSSGEEIGLKYKKDEESTWTTIFTETTADKNYHQAINIESDSSNLPQFREIQFRLISSGGAIITGLKVKYEIIKDNIAD